MRIRRFGGGCRSHGGGFLRRHGGMRRCGGGGGIFRRGGGGIFRNRRHGGGCNVNRVNSRCNLNRADNSHQNYRSNCPGNVCPVNNHGYNKPDNVNGILNNINNSNNQINSGNNTNSAPENLLNQGRISQDLTGNQVNGNQGQNQNPEFMDKINSSPQMKEAFGNLSPTEQKRYLGLQDTYSGNNQERMNQAQATNNGLQSILGQGKLQNKDNFGNSLLDNLSAMKNQNFAQGLDGNKAFSDTVQDIANPDRIQQGDRGTCTVTTIQHLNASKYPSEYARINRGLTSEQGSVLMRNGDTINRDAGTISGDNSGRNDVSRIYQSAMMEYGNGAMDYSNATDWNTGGGGESHKGLYGTEENRVMNAVLPYDSQVKNGGSSALSDLLKSLQSGKPTSAGITTPGGNHEVLVEGMDRNYVYIRNPQGSSNGGHEKIPLREFKERVIDYQVPT